MKQELFHKIVEAVRLRYEKDTGDAKYGDRKITVTENDEFITYFFCDTGYQFGKTRTMIEQAKAIFKEKGYKGNEVYTAIAELQARIGTHGLTRSALRILYDKKKDKISIGERIWGFEWGARKERFYPVAKTTPVFCYSKHMYSFKNMGKSKLLPRISKGASLPTTYGDIIIKTILGIEYTPQLERLSREYIGTVSDFDLINKMYNVKVPTALQEFSAKDVETLYQGLANIGEINKVCQFIASGKPQEVLKEKERRQHEIFGPMHSRISLFPVLAIMMLNDVSLSWLIQDWITDHIRLKRKMSLKVTSKSRIEDEHRKMTKEIMIKGIKEVKVHEKYKTLFQDSDLSFELIQDKTRLLQESLLLDHCVASYGNQINSGSCAIFSFKWEEKSYTLQVNHEFHNVQFRGHRNCDAPLELSNKVDVYLANYRMKNLSKENTLAELPF